MAAEDYQFIRISDENLSDFRALAKNVFGVEFSPEASRKLFDTEAWGKKYIGFLAYDRKGEAAAFYGVFPVFAERDGKQILIAQSGATMTHTNHRKKNLFYELGRKTYELAREEGIAFVYGFPNANSYRGLMKLDWTHDGNIKSYHVIVPTLPLGFLGRKIKLFEWIHDLLFDFVTGFWRAESRPFPNSVIEPGIGGIRRDTAFLNYKQDDKNRFMMKIGERLVWINYRQGSLGIGDVEIADEAKDFKKILRTLKLICFLTGTEHLRTYVSPGCRLDKLLGANGCKFREGLANCYLNLGSDLQPENFKYVYADFDTF